ncbi:trypsin-like serine peptidase [Tessaracoccus coleopterorum]|uniref:trypsin-like serine peptidase n=1 Tax=Tessaracoccus coleopterorum TaxID=2714950 RepID=UPI001E40CCDF|nr:trypsin-like peptidase domain-containing protein [Tessaracoccus coleopterorum]
MTAAAAVVLAGCAPVPPELLPRRPSPVPGAHAVRHRPDPGRSRAPMAPEDLSLYGGVARLDTSSACTGTLIETGVDKAPAYILTNGHCVGMDNAAAGDILVDGEGAGEAHFFDVLGAAEGSVRSVQVARYEYGTMRGVDIGIIRLDTTLGELRAAGAVPLPITGTAPAVGTEVVNIAAPSQGLKPPRSCSARVSAPSAGRST